MMPDSLQCASSKIPQLYDISGLKSVFFCAFTVRLGNSGWITLQFHQFQSAAIEKRIKIKIEHYLH